MWHADPSTLATEFVALINLPQIGLLWETHPVAYRHSTEPIWRSHGAFETSACVGGMRNDARSVTTSAKGGGDSISFPLRRKAFHWVAF